MRDKVILVDCDGVLVDWSYSFNQWMKDKGHKLQLESEYATHERYGIERSEAYDLVKRFNASSKIAYLTPLRDAIHYVKLLHEKHGYVFHCISSLANSPKAYEYRKHNLKALFGSTVFEKIVCLDIADNKQKVLEEYKNTGCVWIEDKVKNAEVGYELGLFPILMKHTHNEKYETEYPVVNNWEEIYNMLT